jgi:predicted DNA binding protein
MSLFGEFRVPAEAFALHATLQALPEIVVEIDRVVAAEDRLTPYFWIADGEPDEIAAATDDDPSIRNLRRLDEFDETTLYRAEWTENIETLVYAYTNVGATILEATGEADEWILRMRFDDREQLTDFQEYCEREEISFELAQLHEITYPPTGARYGLTPKQNEALVTAWEMRYFESPHEASLSDVADELGIASSTLSERLRRAHDELIAHALVVSHPTELGD